MSFIALSNILERRCLFGYLIPDVPVVFLLDGFSMTAASVIMFDTPYLDVVFDAIDQKRQHYHQTHSRSSSYSSSNYSCPSMASSVSKTQHSIQARISTIPHLFSFFKSKKRNAKGYPKLAPLKTFKHDTEAAPYPEVPRRNTFQYSRLRAAPAPLASHPVQYSPVRESFTSDLETDSSGPSSSLSIPTVHL